MRPDDLERFVSAQNADGTYAFCDFNNDHAADVAADSGPAVFSSVNGVAGPFLAYTFATVHPASVLRAPDEVSRHQAKQAFFADIALVGQYYREIDQS